MKRILVYPCGTEIGLEVYRAMQYSIHYELIGGSSNYDHGRFVYENHIDDLPFITDKSTREDIDKFNKDISSYNIDMIYPAMDGVLTVFSKYRDALTPIVIAPDYETTQVTRSKKRTYETLYGRIPVPKLYSNEQIESGNVIFPIFSKPDIGQGAVGTKKINDISDFRSFNRNDGSQLFLEYLPGIEYTIDCFTNSEGKLIYCKGRTRKRIKNGISVNAFFVEKPEFVEYAEIINKRIHQKGGWFFQLKESSTGELKILEVASRIAGTSAITRNIGVNLPLLTTNLYNNIRCDDVIINDYEIELDRALENRYKVKLDYKTVYIDYDDTVVCKGKVNLSVIKFLYQCLNNKKRIILLTKHEGNLEKELVYYRINNIFDEVIHISKTEEKINYIKEKKSIFVDDSYGERRAIHERMGISVFDINALECLMEG